MGTRSSENARGWDMLLFDTNPRKSTQKAVFFRSCQHLYMMDGFLLLHVRALGCACDLSSRSWGCHDPASRPATSLSLRCAWKFMRSAAPGETSTLKGWELEVLQGSPLKLSQGIMWPTSSRLLPTATAPLCVSQTADVRGSAYVAFNSEKCRQISVQHFCHLLGMTVDLW